MTSFKSILPSTRQKGFSIIELVTSISLLAILVLAIIIQINPFELARERRDARLKKDATILLNAIGNFTNEEHRLPWSDDLGGEIARPALNWTEAKKHEIGVCGDDACQKGGELVEKHKLAIAFTRGGTVNSTREDSLLVGKGKLAESKVFVCFLPQSQKERENYNELYSLDFEIGITSQGVPTSCSDEVSWENNDLCYICL